MKTIISLFSDYRAEQERSRRLDAFLTNALIDSTLIDRILADRNDGPEVDEPLPLDDAPFFKPRNIDGILHYAA
jgi:hypothetical protein